MTEPTTPEQVAYAHRHRECGPDCVITGDECPPFVPTGCGWLVERRVVITDEMAGAGWYPDFPSDLVNIVPCGALPVDLRGLCSDHQAMMDMDGRAFESMVEARRFG